jgi:hypothetical protein
MPNPTNYYYNVGSVVWLAHVLIRPSAADDKRIPAFGDLSIFKIAVSEKVLLLEPSSLCCEMQALRSS